MPAYRWRGASSRLSPYMITSVSCVLNIFYTSIEEVHNFAKMKHIYRDKRTPDRKRPPSSNTRVSNQQLACLVSLHRTTALYCTALNCIHSVCTFPCSTSLVLRVRVSGSVCPSRKKEQIFGKREGILVRFKDIFPLFDEQTMK